MDCPHEQGKGEWEKKNVQCVVTECVGFVHRGHVVRGPPAEPEDQMNFNVNVLRDGVWVLWHGEPVSAERAAKDVVAFIALGWAFQVQPVCCACVRPPERTWVGGKKEGVLCQ